MNKQVKNKNKNQKLNNHKVNKTKQMSLTSSFIMTSKTRQNNSINNYVRNLSILSLNVNEFFDDNRRH